MHPFSLRTVEMSSGFAKLLLCLGMFALSTLFAGSAAGPATAADTGDSRSAVKWMHHPALEGFTLDEKALPQQIFLVRTRGRLPHQDGITVHGSSHNVFVVSGDEETVLALTRRGCSVTPLDGPPSPSRSPMRRWIQVDTPDTTIEAMVAQVNWTDVEDQIQWLVDFGTRYSYASNHHAVAESIGAAFAGYGLTPVLSSFVYNSATMWNVEATQTGTVYPDSFFIICGHFDCTSEMAMTAAPGADDNGTGTATVLTAAEILTQHDFEYSIRYVCFGGEEQGLRGSAAYANEAAAGNVGIVGVLNFDMMGYWEPGVEKDLEIETNNASQWLALAIINAANLYTGAAFELHVYDGAWWGDHASFWDVGYAAVNHEEAWDWGDPDFNPYYHSTSDLPVYLGSDFVVGNIRIGIAALATLAVLVPDVTGVDDPVSPPRFTAALSAFPNPFNGRITFTVAGLTGRDDARIRIYDVGGRRVATVPVVLQDGAGTVEWKAMNESIREIGAGVYFGKLEGIQNAAPVKFVYLK